MVVIKQDGTPHTPELSDEELAGVIRSAWRSLRLRGYDVAIARSDDGAIVSSDPKLAVVITRLTKL